MPEKKKYSNVNFTKRVDHEAGHVPRRPAHEPAVCSDCGAIYRHRRWVLASNKSLDVADALPTTCPACLQIRSGEPAGFVFIDGLFVGQHRDEIAKLLRNECDRAMDDNPLARIIDWSDSDRAMSLTTTTEHLAQRLGRSLKRAFDGDVRYDFSHENKLARVYWHRD
jgi:hypothetical protein